MKSILKIFFIISIAVLAVSFFMKDRLPDSSEILDETRVAPLQSETTAGQFVARAGGTAYLVNPRFDYELTGMVVSFHNSFAYNDYAHKEWGDYLNIMDMCVLWGSNLDGNLYKKFKFTNMNWTCFYKTGDDTAWHEFKQNEISNNHLLVEDQAITKLARTIGVGDQIDIKGYLVDYSAANGFNRKTSVTREDTGQGACEVVYLTDLKFLKRANFLWRKLFPVSAVSAAMSALILAALFFTSPENRRKSSFES